MPWQPGRIAAAKGRVEVYKSEAMELRRGDRVRFTRNDPATGLTNGETATVDAVGRDGVRFRLENGSLTTLRQHDPQLRHIDRASAATVHAFQGRTVDRILAAMPAENPNLVNQRAFYVTISRARDAAQLVTDDAHRLADRLERAAYEALFGRDPANERDANRLTRGSHAMDRGHEAARDGQDGHERERPLDRGMGRETRREHERDGRKRLSHLPHIYGVEFDDPLHEEGQPMQDLERRDPAERDWPGNPPDEAGADSEVSTEHQPPRRWSAEQKAQIVRESF